MERSTALTIFKRYNTDRIALAKLDQLDEVSQVQLIRDLLLEGMAERAHLDHIRIFKTEQMLAFFLKKQVVKVERKPTAEEANMLPLGASVTEARSWLDEFEKEFNALQVAATRPAAPNGDNNGEGKQ